MGNRTDGAEAGTGGGTGGESIGVVAGMVQRINQGLWDGWVRMVTETPGVKTLTMEVKLVFLISTVYRENSLTMK